MKFSSYEIKRGWSLFILFCVVTLFTSCSLKQKKPEPGLVVLFNGTSSAGKSAIVNELQGIYGPDWSVVVLDDFQVAYQKEHPISASEREAMKAMPIEKLRLLFRKIHEAMYYHVKQLALQGKNVFVDTVEFDDDYDHYCSILGFEKVVKILVYCPLDVIVDRVQKRALEGSPRSLNLVWGQFPAIYKLQESDNDVVVDRIATSRISTKLPLVREEAKLIPDEAVSESDFVKQFGLDTLDEIVLVPKHQWDLIVNTGIHSPEEVAQEVVGFLEKRGYQRPTDVFRVDPQTYDQYVGSYRLADNFTFAITKEGNKLFVRPEKQGKIELHPKSEAVFFNHYDEFELSFVKDEKGEVTEFILHQGGADSPAKKIA